MISGGTYSGNPLTIAAGVAAMQLMTPAEYARLDALGARLREGANAIFKAAGIPGQMTDDASLFAMVLTDQPIVHYRGVPRDAATAERVRLLHLALLDEGVIVSNRGMGCLSTPMGEAEIGHFLAALERSLARLPKE